LAGESVGVKDTSVAATIPPSFPLDAEVEELAIIRIRMPRVLMNRLNRGIGAPELEKLS